METCEKCIYLWQLKRSERLAGPDVYQCRRYPPVLIPAQEFGQWPRVNKDYGCGEFRIREEKKVL